MNLQEYKNNNKGGTGTDLFQGSSKGNKLFVKEGKLQTRVTCYRYTSRELWDGFNWTDSQSAGKLDNEKFGPLVLVPPTFSIHIIV